MTGWNFADVWEAVAEAVPDAPALVQGDRRQNWRETDRRANGVASALIAGGVSHQDKVAQYLYNCPEYLESIFAIFKAGLAPVNTNYRYGSEELTYLWDNSDAVAVVFHGTFSERVEQVRDRLPRVRLWLWVDDGTGPCPEWAEPYEQAASQGTGEPVRGPWGRSGDDLYLLYTGGTTGMPKGVMWRQDDLFLNVNAASHLRYPDDATLDTIRASIAAPGIVHLPACPLMHGTGALTSFNALDTGGSVVTLTKRSFDEIEMLDAIRRERVNTAAIVGDAFAKPMLRALDSEPDRWDLSSLFMIISSGVMWSESTKEGIHRHHPGVLLVDAFSSSEALGMGTSVSTAGAETSTARFTLGENTRVIDEDGKDVVAGSGQVGLLAVGGRNPVGYYKDPEKTARTFKVIDGRRYSIPGDHATVESDGTLRLLGRGSLVINTGGEKVFPEEVEEAAKLTPGVRDVVVVGVPDERFGESICAVVETHPGAEVSEEDVVSTVRSQLARYKAPRRVVFMPSLRRAPNGKADYGRLRDEAASRVGAS